MDVPPDAPADAPANAPASETGVQRDARVHREMLQSIDNDYDGSPAPNQIEKNPIRRSITDILGPKENRDPVKAFESLEEYFSDTFTQTAVNGYWWRMYINKKDQRDANFVARRGDLTRGKLMVNDPGFYYDTDSSPGFKRSMTNAYQKYLIFTDDTIQQFNLALKTGRLERDPGFYKKLTFELYQEMFQTTTTGTTGTSFSLSVDPKVYTTFTNEADIADDIKNVRYGDISLVGPTPLSGDLRFNFPDPMPPRLFMVQYSVYGQMVQKYEQNNIDKNGTPRTEPMIFTWGRGDWENIINLMFDRYHRSYAAANTRLQQLTAIAALIRDIHVAHIWSDGNGRVNINLLLPMLLLWNGFGLPLGGRHKAKYRFAWEYFVGGSWPLESIAKYLWISQDFGIQGPREDTIIFDHTQ